MNDRALRPAFVNRTQRALLQICPGIYKENLRQLGVYIRRSGCDCFHSEVVRAGPVIFGIDKSNVSFLGLIRPNAWNKVSPFAQPWSRRRKKPDYEKTIIKGAMPRRPSLCHYVDFFMFIAQLELFHIITGSSVMV